MRDVADVVGKIAASTARDRLLIAARRGEPLTEFGDQTAALLDTAAALDAAGIPYALIGGIAVGIHTGLPRATQDVDLAVPTSKDRDVVVGVLTAAGYALSGSFAHSINLRHPNNEPVQLAFDPSFDEIVERADVVSIGTTAVRIARKDDLIQMKQRAAEDPARRKSKALRDRSDIELLLGDVGDPDEGW